VGSIPRDGWIHSICVTPGYLYVASAWDPPETRYFLASKIARIDPVTLAVVDTRRLVHVPVHLACSPDDRTLFAPGQSRVFLVAWE